MGASNNLEAISMFTPLLLNMDLLIIVHPLPRYGVRQSFAPEDLTELKNIEKVSKCVEELCNLVRA